VQPCKLRVRECHDHAVSPDRPSRGLTTRSPPGPAPGPLLLHGAPTLPGFHLGCNLIKILRPTSFRGRGRGANRRGPSAPRCAADWIPPGAEQKAPDEDGVVAPAGEQQPPRRCGSRGCSWGSRKTEKPADPPPRPSCALFTSASFCWACEGRALPSRGGLARGSRRSATCGVLMGFWRWRNRARGAYPRRPGSRRTRTTQRGA
jgi:hypothetical protein